MSNNDVFISALTYNAEKDYNEVTVSKVYIYNLEDGSRRTKTFNIIVRSKDNTVNYDAMIAKGLAMLRTQYVEFIRDKHIVINV
jgi:hypothetical protein